MIVVSLAGGLGNQLFQYAHARTLSSRYSIPIFLDKRLLDPSVSNRPYADIRFVGEEYCDDRYNYYLQLMI